MYIYKFCAIISSATVTNISFDLVPWVGDLRRTGVNFAYLASLQFKEFVARPVPKALDFLERETSISDMILFKVFSSSLDRIVREQRVPSQFSFPVFKFSAKNACHSEPAFVAQEKQPT